MSKIIPNLKVDIEFLEDGDIIVRDLSEEERLSVFEVI